MSDTGLIKVTSDIRLAFKDMGISVQSMLNSHSETIDAIVKSAVDEFDFEILLTAHINNKIETAIEDAFSEMDLKDTMKAVIWAELNKRLTPRED